MIGQKAKAPFKIFDISHVKKSDVARGQSLANQRLRISAGFLEDRGFHRKKTIEGRVCLDLVYDISVRVIPRMNSLGA